MKIIKPSFEIMNLSDKEVVLRYIELAGRTCYKSEGKICEGSAEKMMKKLIDSKHESVLEHISFSVRFICDRGITHELVRHRLCAFSQESTRYANYSNERFGNEITVIKPSFWKDDSLLYLEWLRCCKANEKYYLWLLANGAKPQEARSVLPTCLKADIVTTTNLREWRHILKLRCSAASHPQIRELMLPLLDELHNRIPVIFDDLYEQFSGNIRVAAERREAWS